MKIFKFLWKSTLQWNLSKAGTYGREVFVRFGEVWTEKFPNLRYGCFTMDPLSHRLLLPLDYGNAEWWKRSNVFSNASVYLTSKVIVVSYFLLLFVSDHNVLQLFSYHFQQFKYFAILILPGKTWGRLFSNYPFVSEPRVSFLDNGSLLSNKNSSKINSIKVHVLRNICYFSMYGVSLSLNYRYITSQSNWI